MGRPHASTQNLFYQKTTASHNLLVMISTSLKLSCGTAGLKHRSHSTGHGTCHWLPTNKQHQKCLLALITLQICCFRSKGNVWLSCSLLEQRLLVLTCALDPPLVADKKSDIAMFLVTSRIVIYMPTRT